ncbi:MAG: class I SAM-dependent methyltransferase, partial [Thermoplasmata archaeon]
MTQIRMYDEFANLWPLISAPEDYAEEAGYWRELLRGKLGRGRHEILELGVGGGNNLSHLTSDFQATAVDISEKMLANSIRLNPGVEHHVGDMRTVRLGRTFKAVLIHDAIDYLLSEAEIRDTFATARTHLQTGGVFITAPDWYRETFLGRSVSSKTRCTDRLELTVIEYCHDPDTSDTTIETV